MANDYTICVGTVGEGIYISPNAGKSWNRVTGPFPAPYENEIRSLAIDPNNPHRIVAGSDVGIYSSDDNGLNWKKMDSPMDGKQIWSVTVHPGDPNTIFAGTKPPAIYRSRDGGENWEQLSVDIAEECFAGEPKVTSIVVDPRDHQTVWMGVEIDGVFKSMDGGDTWTHMSPLGEDVLHQDIHSVGVSAGPRTQIVAATPAGVFSSSDEGESWELHEFPRFNPEDPFSYCRGITVSPGDPNTMFVGNGDTIPGDTGTIQRTRDGGRTWEAARLPVEPNSNIYWVGMHPANPDRIVANSINGEIYVSDDAGDSWEKIKREFGEIRAIAWLPN